MKTRPLLLLLAVLLAGCALRPAAVAPAGADEWPLLAPASFGRSAQFEQVLHAAYGDQEASLQCIVDIGPDLLTVVGLTASGQRVFTLRYDGTQVTAERSPLAPDTVRPRRILADLQFALWPLEALQAATAGTAWTVTEPRPGVRRLRQGEVLVAELHRAGEARLWLAALREGYTLDITTREAPP